MEIKKIVFATHNDGKIAEVKKIFEDLKGLTIVSAEEAGVMEDVVEDGNTFASNAYKKALFVGSKTNEWTMADDSGICVDALGGRPGIHSARWAGENAPGYKWVEKLLLEMKDVLNGQRTARFETMAVLLSPKDGDVFFFKGEVRGRITLSPRGVTHPNLPYDAVFIPNEGDGRTFSEMSKEEKNAISHRARAFTQLKEFIQRF